MAPPGIILQTEAGNGGETVVGDVGEVVEEIGTYTQDRMQGAPHFLSGNGRDGKLLYRQAEGGHVQHLRRKRGTSDVQVCIAQQRQLLTGNAAPVGTGAERFLTLCP